MENRAAKFRLWLEQTGGFRYVNEIRTLTHPQATGLLATYIHQLSISPYNNAGHFRMANTLTHHLTAAHAFLAQHMIQPLPLYSHTSGGHRIIPFLGAFIDLRRKWQVPRPKRQPYTLNMLQHLHDEVEAGAAKHTNYYLSLPALVFDAIRLGIFTGSRVSEYAQSKGSRSHISTVPDSHPDPSLRGQPIAFIAQDFLFLDANHIRMSHTRAMNLPHSAVELHVTFRYDKSSRNHSVRKFGPGTRWLCPILAAIRILLRAHHLLAPASHPIFIYQGHDGSPKLLRADEVTSVMRAVCTATYTNPNHYMRLHISGVTSHSNWVTAAVALWRAGTSTHDIAHRLRWKPESVEHYIRECSQDIGRLTEAAIAGATRPA